MSFLLFLVLARSMTPAAFADVAVVFAWLAIAAALVCFSAPLVLIRYLPEALAQGRADYARGVLQFQIAATVGGAIAIAILGVAAIWFGMVKFPRDLAKSASIGLLLLIPSVLLLDLAGLLVALKRAAISELLVNFLRPTALLATLLVLWYFEPQQFSASTVLTIYLVASIAIGALGVGYALTLLPRDVLSVTPTYSIRVWLRTATGFMTVAIMAAVNERIDLLVMAMIASPEDVASYAVAARFAQSVLVATTAAATVMAPHLVERLQDLRSGRRDELRVLIRNTSRTAFFVSLVALVIFASLGPLILQLFGPHYSQAYVPLLLLTAGITISALTGAAGSFATIVGRPKIAVLGLLTGIITNAALNLILVPAMGANGAALASAAGCISASVLAWWLTLRHFRLDTSVFGLRVS